MALMSKQARPREQGGRPYRRDGLLVAILAAFVVGATGCGAATTTPPLDPVAKRCAGEWNDEAGSEAVLVRGAYSSGARTAYLARPGSYCIMALPVNPDSGSSGAGTLINYKGEWQSLAGLTQQLAEAAAGTAFLNPNRERVMAVVEQAKTWETRAAEDPNESIAQDGSLSALPGKGGPAGESSQTESDEDPIAGTPGSGGSDSPPGPAEPEPEPEPEPDPEPEPEPEPANRSPSRTVRFQTGRDAGESVAAAYCSANRRMATAPTLTCWTPNDGFTLRLDEAGARRVRAEEIANRGRTPRYPELALGARRSAFGFVCTSRSSGLRCVNDAEHGWDLPRYVGLPKTF